MKRLFGKSATTSWHCLGAIRKLSRTVKAIGWHRHEEYEIAIHRHFAGHSFIGHHQSDVFHNHMILVGPDLPHAIYSDESADDQRVCETHVVWFRKDWIEPLIGQLSRARTVACIAGRFKERPAVFVRYRREGNGIVR